jgi:hypothetical protein
MKRIIIGMAFVLGVVAFAPQPVAAEDCARGYASCLNDSWDLSGLLQVLADIECGADYVGCIRSKVLGL